MAAAEIMKLQRRASGVLETSYLVLRAITTEHDERAPPWLPSAKIPVWLRETSFSIHTLSGLEAAMASLAVFFPPHHLPYYLAQLNDKLLSSVNTRPQTEGGLLKDWRRVRWSRGLPMAIPAPAKDGSVQLPCIQFPHRDPAANP